MTAFIAKLRAMPDSEPSSSRSRTPDRFTPDDADGDGCSRSLLRAFLSLSDFLSIIDRDISFSVPALRSRRLVLAANPIFRTEERIGRSAPADAKLY
ncbi:hypothetical protein DTW90_10960 [Neorhizobium sp. P12A]|nr:hypothetical protein DTW90_10960 [Neorhizobium sp. P12A]